MREAKNVFIRKGSTTLIFFKSPPSYSCCFKTETFFSLVFSLDFWTSHTFLALMKRLHGVFWGNDTTILSLLIRDTKFKKHCIFKKVCTFCDDVQFKKKTRMHVKNSAL